MSAKNDLDSAVVRVEKVRWFLAKGENSLAQEQLSVEFSTLLGAMYRYRCEIEDALGHKRPSTEIEVTW